MKVLRTALYSDTTLAWDIECAYQCFMILLARAPVPRLTEIIKNKKAVRAMVAAALKVTEEELRTLLHAMTNGRSLRRWAAESRVEAVTAESLAESGDNVQAAGDRVSKFVLTHEGWAARDGALLWSVLQEKGSDT